ncbi:MAG: RNA 2',3'-cyclic phosphodiesterase [Clostridiales Family XIII bacterium]|jgi:2'-5' RNA ligase|nr:RNA 2',3'-cyclic phosphodiesterase [Clostridiales Family XIII bacterium]
MRLFIAINFSEEIKDALCETIADLRDASRRGRYTHRDNLHLTLVFIGESDRVDDVMDVMEDACDDAFTEPIRIALADAGVFRRKGGDVHWIGVERSPELKKLAERIASGLRREGFDIERRKFTPHITIGREVKLSADARIRAPMASMYAERVSLMRSDRIDGRLVYSEVASIDIAPER